MEDPRILRREAQALAGIIWFRTLLSFCILYSGFSIVTFDENRFEAFLFIFSFMVIGASLFSLPALLVFAWISARILKKTPSYIERFKALLLTGISFLSLYTICVLFLIVGGDFIEMGLLTLVVNIAFVLASFSVKGRL